MSSRCMAAVFERYPVGDGEFILALALADNAHDDGAHIFPSVATMAVKSRQSERSVQRHLQAMIARGWLLRVRNGGGRGVHSEYRISPNWLKGADLSPFSGLVDNSENGANMSPFGAQKGDKRRTKRVTNDAQKGDKRSTPYITERTSIGITPLPPAAGGECGFEEFFAEYPRKVSAGQARQEWAKLSPDEALRKRITSAVRAWARSPEWERNDGQFIPKPARWLREQRWEDVPGVSLAPTPAAPPPRMVESAPLTPEQLKANAERARALAAHARQAIGMKAAPRTALSARTGTARDEAAA